METYTLKKTSLVEKLDGMIDLHHTYCKNEEFPFHVEVEAPQDLIDRILSELRKAYKHEPYPTAMTPVNIFTEPSHYVYTPNACIRLKLGKELRMTFLKDEAPTVSDHDVENDIAVLLR